MIKGIDVSAIQGGIDWQRVARAGIGVAYIKCTEGLAQAADPRFRANALGSKAAGIATGAYHFCKPSLSPGMRTAQDDARGEVQRFAHFSDLLGAADGEMPPALDFEALYGTTPEWAAEWLMWAIDETTKLWGKSPVIYTNQYDDKGQALDRVLTQVPEVYELRLWRAGYPLVGSGAARRAITWDEAAARMPKLPPIKPWGKVWAWQFSGGGPSVPGNRVDGVPVVVDCNWFTSI